MGDQNTTIAPNAELETLKLELEQTKKENKKLKQQARFGTELPEEMEASVQSRIAAGLTREQAIQVERDQLREDEAAAARAKAAKK